MSPAPDARTRILLSAEFLIAEQGPSVSLREIAAHAGQKNNSAVHYYFGTRDALIEALVDKYQPLLEQDRLVALAQEQPADVADVVRILIKPMFSVPYAAGSTHYARCLEKIRDHPAVRRDPFPDSWAATRMLIDALDQMLGTIPTRLRMARLYSLITVMFGLLADVERSSPVERAEAEQNVLDMIVAMLLAPTTPATDR